MEENGEQDKQEVNSHLIRKYFKSSENMISDHANGDVSNSPRVGGESVRMSNPDQQGNKHSYFLRAKIRRRSLGRWASDENGASEINSSSSFGKKLIVLGKDRASQLTLSSPTPSPGLNSTEEEEEDLANCLVMLSKTSYALSGDPGELSNRSYALSGDQKYGSKGKQVEEKGMFQCKACKKMFNSHQALGGHRASHKRVKGCFAAKLESITDNNDSMDEDWIQEEHESLTSCRSDPSGHVSATSTKKRHNKMHECSVCRRVFSSGQALGGHKRCHWLTTSTDNAFIPTFQEFHYSNKQNQQICKKPAMFTNLHQDENDQEHQLDLNLNLSQVDDKTDGTETTSRFYIQEQLTTANNNQQNIPNTANGKVEKGCSQINKVRKLSDLRDVNYDGGWLQMGIATTGDIYK